MQSFKNQSIKHMFLTKSCSFYFRISVTTVTYNCVFYVFNFEILTVPIWVFSYLLTCLDNFLSLLFIICIRIHSTKPLMSKVY